MNYGLYGFRPYDIIIIAIIAIVAIIILIIIFEVIIFGSKNLLLGLLL